MSAADCKDSVSETSVPSDFIRTIINNDLASGKHKTTYTRFPPEPNGYLHIGHVKSITLNFGIKEQYNGFCNLRFDDTNPTKEEQEYVDSIRNDVHWLGYNWDEERFASDYFDQMYSYALKLIDEGKAYVCELTPDQVREYRGTLTEPGKPSPGRKRSIAENRELFERMRKGDFPDGQYTLRAKIDMASPNINLRDPAIYRIRHARHHRTGDSWCIYPMYDFAHCISDALEGITHSICTLEFEDHRPLYNWYLEQLDTPKRPQQIEFARLNISYTVLSKRKLLQLVQEKKVSGWDDPRMPTIAGLRRRGYTPEALRLFCQKIGVSKANSTVDLGLLEYCLRQTFNTKAERRMAVIDPIKVVITNYPSDKEEFFEAENNPENPASGKRKVPFCRELFIEREDFMENPPKKFFRLVPGGEVRLMHAYFIKCNEVIKDPEGNIIELQCTYDPASKGGNAADGRKVKGTLHWVSARHAIAAEVRLYNNLFSNPDPEDIPEGSNWLAGLNPESLIVHANARVEPELANAENGQCFQFLRQGYFCGDPKDSSPSRLVFNRTVTLRDTWAKLVDKN